MYNYFIPLFWSSPTFARMKKFLGFWVLFVSFFYACKNSENTTSENDLDAARNFIRAALDGDYSKTRDYMLQDSLNTQLLNAFEDNYQKKMSAEDKLGYHEASIRTPDTRKINDSVSIITYSNSYKNKTDSLKVVRVNGQWLVDFKYSFRTTQTDIMMPKDSANTTKDPAKK